MEFAESKNIMFANYNMNCSLSLNREYFKNITYVCKNELFDENVMADMLTNHNMNRDDKKLLQTYHKKRNGISNINVCYTLGKNCDELKVGRLFPKDRLSIGGMRWDIRNPLAEKFYWDIDICNCHITIAYHYCKENNLKYDTMEYYINNREKVLSSISNDRDKAKIEILKICYGGQIDILKDSFIDYDYYDSKGDIRIDEGYTFLKELQNEFNILSLYLFDTYKHMIDVKIGKEKISKRLNPKASLCALFLQTEERIILLAIDSFLISKGRSLDVLIHDGGYIRKLEGENEPPMYLIDECQEYVYKSTGYMIKLAFKPITHQFTLKIQNEDIDKSYIQLKQEHETRNFFFYDLGVYGFIDDLNKLNIRKQNDMFVIHRYKFYKELDIDTGKMKKKRFIESWFDDPHKKKYSRFDFFPNCHVNDNVFNTFNGWKAESLPNHDLDFKDSLMYKHLTEVICDSNPQIFEWVMRWCHNVLFRPFDRCNVNILCHSEKYGTGKSLFFDVFLGQNVIGDTNYYYAKTADEIFLKFNSILESKVLCVCDETSRRDTFDIIEKIKAQTTCNSLRIERKGYEPYMTNHYTHYVFNSNSNNPIYLDFNERRFFAFQCSSKYAQCEEYFNPLRQEIKDKTFVYAFYKFVQDYDSTNFNFESKRVITEYYKDIQTLNRPHIVSFLDYMMSEEQDYFNDTKKSIDVFTTYRRVLDYLRIKDDISHTKFGVDLKKVKGVYKRHSNGKVYIFNVDEIKEYLSNFALSY